MDFTDGYRFTVYCARDSALQSPSDRVEHFFEYGRGVYAGVYGSTDCSCGRIARLLWCLVFGVLALNINELKIVCGLNSDEMKMVIMIETNQ